MLPRPHETFLCSLLGNDQSYNPKFGKLPAGVEIGRLWVDFTSSEDCWNRVLEVMIRPGPGSSPLSAGDEMEEVDTQGSRYIPSVGHLRNSTFHWQLGRFCGSGPVNMLIEHFASWVS